MGGGQVSIAARQTCTPVAAQFEFESLKPLPCGCVAAVYRTLDPGLSVMSLEAKGPYCGVWEHLIGRVAAVPSTVANEIGIPGLDEE